MPSHSARARGGVFAVWQPAAVTTADVIGLKLVLAFFALIRAGDYVHGARDRFAGIEAAAPLWVWSLAAYTVAMLILVGVAARVHFAVWLGHAVGVVLYVAITIGTMQDAMRGWPPDPGIIVEQVPIGGWHVGALASLAILAAAWVSGRARHHPDWRVPAAALTIGAAAIVLDVALTYAPIDGLRGAGPLLIVASLHALFAARSGPWPIQDAEAEAAETIAQPAAAS